MRVLVTGGAGFIGSNFVRKATEMGWDVSVLDDLSTGLEANLVDSVRFIKGSIETISMIERAAKDCDAILHLAARGSVPRSIGDPVATHNVNTLGTWNVLEYARNSGQYVIYSSSSSVFGRNVEQPKRQTSWMSPMSPYAATKLAGEAYAQAYVESFNMKALVLRFFNVFGPFQRADSEYAAVIPKWIRACELNEPLDLFGDGEQSRDFTYVGSVAEVLIQACQNSLTAELPLNLGFGKPKSLNKLFEMLQETYPLARINRLPARAGEVRSSAADPEPLLQAFPGVEPLGLEKALKQTIRWYKENPKYLFGSTLSR